MKASGLFLKKMLPAGLAFGTAWAARGQIGHEYGATWAAAIGIGTVIVLSGRKDWYERFPVIVALGAIAWGSGGMISYGSVVGYGQAADYINTSYGLLMLMVIGCLYGFLGGGITGLALESDKEKKTDWAALFVQMFAGGFLVWGVLIYQLGWLMTPPRSELWAASLGASLALGWYLYRNGKGEALRVAFFSALGAGFGFAFGNFLQRMGLTTGISFNWWNVMEYSIGFFSGLGLAYGIFVSGNWPAGIAHNRMSNMIAWIFLIVMLPVFNLVEGVKTSTMVRTGTIINAPDPAAFAFNWQIVLWVISVILMIVLLKVYKPATQKAATANQSMGFVLIYMIWYIVISNVISAIWITPKFSSQHLYWVNLVAVWLFLKQSVARPAEIYSAASPQYAGRLVKWWIAAVVLILVLSYIAISIGYVNHKTDMRFKF